MAVSEYKRSENTRLTENFRQNEFDCRGSTCGCKSTSIDRKLVRKLQVLRMIIGKAITVSSGYRCSAHNRTVGGASASYHTKGMAADISCVGISPESLAKAAQSIGFSGIGCYNGAAGRFVHVDVREKSYFWKNSGSGNVTASGFGGKQEFCPYKLSERTLRTGSRGEDVKALQWLLSRCSISCDTDGIFGEKTKAALKSFQNAMLLESDGVFGRQSRLAIEEALT